MSNGTICPIGPSIFVATTTTVAVANVVTGTNTIRLTNNGATDCYVNVFKTYAEAAAMTHPVAGTPGNAVPLNGNDYVTVIGNFGVQPNPGTVYVAAITSTGSTTVIATPLAP